MCNSDPGPSFFALSPPPSCSSVITAVCEDASFMSPSSISCAGVASPFPCTLGGHADVAEGEC